MNVQMLVQIKINVQKQFIRPEDLEITSADKGKISVVVDTQLFRGVHYEICCLDDQYNEWIVHSTKQAKPGAAVS